MGEITTRAPAAVSAAEIARCKAGGSSSPPVLLSSDRAPGLPIGIAMPDVGPTFKLGRYEVISKIATGGMATVYRAKLDADGGFSREFALKVIHPHLSGEPGFKKRFLDEARIASRVRHPNVAAVVDVGQDRGYQFLVLQLVEGVTLRQLLMHRSRPLPAAEAASLIVDAARALHAVHALEDDNGDPLGVVHRDLSPHNIMLDEGGRAILIDFGLADARDKLGHTETGVLSGKLPYMSPEQTRMQDLDARSDVFSLGSVLYELLCGVPPFGDDHHPRTLTGIQEADAEPLVKAMRAQHIPEWMMVIVLTCLRDSRTERFESAAAVADALEEELAAHKLDSKQLQRALAHHALSVGADLHRTDELVPLPEILPQGEAAKPARRARWPWVAAAVVAGSLITAGSLASDRFSLFDRSPTPDSVSTDPEPGPSTGGGATIPAEVEGEQAAPPAAATESEQPKVPKRRKKKKKKPKLRDNPYTD